MIKDLIGKIWRKMPRPIRQKAIRLTQSKFTVSAAVVVLNSNKEVLLLEHLIRPGNSWGLPGGFLNKGETPQQAVLRELMEETGIKLNNIEYVSTHTNKLHIEVIFSAKFDGSSEVKSYEILDLGWFAINDLPKGFNYSQKSLIEKVLKDES